MCLTLQCISVAGCIMNNKYQNPTLASRPSLEYGSNSSTFHRTSCLQGKLHCYHENLWQYPPDTPNIDGDPLVDPPGPADHGGAGRGVGGGVHRVQRLRVLLRPDQGLHRLQPGHGLHHCLLDITEHLHNLYDVLGPHFKRMVSLLDTMERVEEEPSPPPWPCPPHSTLWTPQDWSVTSLPSSLIAITYPETKNERWKKDVAICILNNDILGLEQDNFEF